MASPPVSASLSSTSVSLLATAEVTITQATLVSSNPVSIGATIITATPQEANGVTLPPIQLSIVLMGYPTPSSNSSSSSSWARNATASRSHPPSSPTAPPPTPAPGLESGAVAGTAVGCLVGGLIIGAAAAFLLLRRKLGKSRGTLASGPVAVTTEPKSFGASPSDSASDRVQLHQFLLDAAPDKEIAAELQSLGELVSLHVENNYHSRPVRSNLSTFAQSLLGLGFDQHSWPDVETIAATCIDAKTRHLGLRHVISYVVFKSVDFHSQSHLSMLPAPVAAFLYSVPRNGRHRGDVDALNTALTRWRCLSAFLLHPERGQRTPFVPVDSVASPQARGLVIALNKFLDPFVLTGQTARAQQVDHLQAVILECARFGYLVISQPSDWQFVYEAAAGGSGMRMLVLCPGLNKSNTQDGRRYRSPRHVVAPLVSQV